RKSPRATDAPDPSRPGRGRTTPDRGTRDRRTREVVQQAVASLEPASRQVAVDDLEYRGRFGRWLTKEANTAEPGGRVVIDDSKVRCQVRKARRVAEQVRDPAPTARIEEPLAVAAELRRTDLELTRRIEHQPRDFQVTESLVIRGDPCSVSIEMGIHPLNIRVILRLLCQERRTISDIPADTECADGSDNADRNAGCGGGKPLKRAPPFDDRNYHVCGCRRQQHRRGKQEACILQC